MTHDYKHHGTAALFAALDVATDQVIGFCLPKHRHIGFLKLLSYRDLLNSVAVGDGLGIPRLSRSLDPDYWTQVIRFVGLLRSGWFEYYSSNWTRPV